MVRKELYETIKNKYGIDPEYPWSVYPDYAVFRHAENKKWFAVLMPLKKSALKIEGDGSIDVLNVKCDPFLAEAITDGKSIFQAYHMNKRHWVSAVIGKLSDAKVEALLEASFGLTE